MGNKSRLFQIKQRWVHKNAPWDWTLISVLLRNCASFNIYNCFFSFTLQTVPHLPFQLAAVWVQLGQVRKIINWIHILAVMLIFTHHFLYLKLKKYKSQWVELHWVFLVLVKHTVNGSLYWPLFIISSINLKVYKTPHFQVVPTFCKTGEERNNAYCSTKYCT